MNDALEIDPDQAAIISRIFALKQAVLLLMHITDTLNAEGYRTGRGNRWRDSSIQIILKHEHLYRTGERVYSNEPATLRWPILLAATSANEG